MFYVDASSCYAVIDFVGLAVRHCLTFSLCHTFYLFIAPTFVSCPDGDEAEEELAATQADDVEGAEGGS